MNDNPILQALEQQRDLILLAEIGALIHDLGKVSKEFIAVKAAKPTEGPGWWKFDVHAEVAKLHSSCVIPTFLAPYFEMPTKAIDMDAVRHRGTETIGNAIHDELAAASGDLCDVLISGTRQLFEKAKNVEGVASQLGRLRQQLEAAIQRRQYRKEQAAQAMRELEQAWGKIETAREGLLADLRLLQEHENRLSREEQVADDFLPEPLRQALMTELTLMSETIRLKDFLELHHRGHWQIPWALHLLRAARPETEDEETQTAKKEPEGCDGLDSALDKQLARKEGKPQEFDRTIIATAFGHEPDSSRIKTGQLEQVRNDYANDLALVLQRVGTERANLAADEALPPEFWQQVLYDDWQTTDGRTIEGLRKRTETTFRQALGETRRGANDVTLWDHCTSVASLYKAALAKVLLERAIFGEEYEFPAPSTIGWRFLRVGVDGLSFFARAHHVTDILGRRQALTDALDKVRQVLEVDYPLGNEVYRDENGSVFVMPGLSDEKAHERLAKEVKELVLGAFRQSGLGQEAVPEVIWNSEGPVREDMIPAFGQLVTDTEKLPPLTSDAQAMRDWWEDPQARGKEICTVCGQRPMGYPKQGSPQERELGLKPWATQEKAKNRNVCRVCLYRRGRRARDWARNVRADDADSNKEKGGPFERSIWTDEVADHNGRFALVVGRFILEDWLNGKLVRTMLVAPGKEKNPSPARIRRCWDTTRQFWLEVQNDVVPSQVSQRLRLGIRPDNVPLLRRVLGRWHTYEADIAGRRLGLCWDPEDEVANDRNLFWTTDNLSYFGRQIGLTERELAQEVDLLFALKERINGTDWPLYEPGGYLGQDKPVTEDALNVQVATFHQFRPYIPILAEPATFMALVPADRALEVARAIKEKYDREMARVRDRLSLHLGLVFAPRRTPLAAVLEAGRAMLAMPDSWEEWQVSTDGRKVTFSRDGRVLEWTYPAKMGDPKTEDSWYPHLLIADPGSTSELRLEAGDLCLVDNSSGRVYIRPGRFDFEFLDTTARRFEIAYQTCEVSETSQVCRRLRRSRPFLLHDLDRLEGLWKEIGRLEKSQRHQVIAAIEATRESWFGDDREGRSLSDGTFRQFVHDTLAGAAWPGGHKWHEMDESVRKKLEDAGVAGALADLAELHMHILKERNEKEDNHGNL
ncbi:MAG: hypothetical protein H8E35_08850 [Ardenticatenia bacterium]|nr:hypothetical protein [Ardenticatenia bacterium]